MKTPFKSPGAHIFVQVLAAEKVPVAHHVMDNISGSSERLPPRVGKREALHEGLTCSLNNHDIDCPLRMEQGGSEEAED